MDAGRARRREPARRADRRHRGVPQPRAALAALRAREQGADAAAFNRLRDEWRITPAISDLWAASMVVLEMHAREPPRAFVAGYASADAVDVRRAQDGEVREYDPEEAEQWVVKELGLAAYLGKIKARKLGGAAAELVERALAPRDAARRRARGRAAPGGARCCAVSTEVDTMQDDIAYLLRSQLSEKVDDRLSTAREVLMELAKCVSVNQQGREQKWYDPRALPNAAGGAYLPESAGDGGRPRRARRARDLRGPRRRAPEPRRHVQRAEACGQWLDAAPNAPGRKRAPSSTASCGKRTASSSASSSCRSARSTATATGRRRCSRRRARSTRSPTRSGRAARRRTSSRSRSTCRSSSRPVPRVRAGLPSVRKINLKGCSGHTGRIPDEIGNCAELRALQLFENALEGRSRSCCFAGSSWRAVGRAARQRRLRNPGRHRRHRRLQRARPQGAQPARPGPADRAR